MKMTVQTTHGAMTMETTNRIQVLTVAAQGADDRFSAACRAHGFRSRWVVKDSDYRACPALREARADKHRADRNAQAAWQATFIYK